MGVAKFMDRQAVVLYFTKGKVPTKEELDEIGTFGPGVKVRNAQLVNSDPSSSSLEECDAVAGTVPERYARAYPSASGGVEAQARFSDFDLPHGHPLDSDNERARGARPANKFTTGRLGVAPVFNPPRENTPFSLKDGGTMGDTPSKANPSVAEDNDPMEQRTGANAPDNPAYSLVPNADLSRESRADPYADPRARAPWRGAQSNDAKGGDDAAKAKADADAKAKADAEAKAKAKADADKANADKAKNAGNK